MATIEIQELNVQLAALNCELMLVNAKQLTEEMILKRNRLIVEKDKVLISLYLQLKAFYGAKIARSQSEILKLRAKCRNPYLTTETVELLIQQIVAEENAHFSHVREFNYVNEWLKSKN